MGFLDLMLDEHPSQKQQYYFDNMNSSSSHILELVKNLLDFQSLEKNKLQSNDVSFSLSLLLDDIYKSFLPMAGKKKIAFELNQTIKEEDKYLSDPYRIRKILNNLISNALKYTPNNGNVCVSASIENGNRLRVSVKDNGSGIGDADKTRIFEEFTRLEETKLMVEGTGLGLTISKSLAQLLGGNIEIESQLGQGSDFVFTLPLTAVPDEPSPVVTPVEEETKHIFSTENIRVLFVDDDVVLLNLYSELMKKAGIAYACCLKSTEALRLLEKEKFDIIFTDIQMPDMKGFELMTKIREFTFEDASLIPVVGLSADLQWQEEHKSSGFTAFLLKPLNAKQLLETIEKYTNAALQTDLKYSNPFDFNIDNLMQFASGDRDVALKMIDSFIEETGNNTNLLKTAFQNKEWDTVRQLSHKMCSLMKMVSAHEIVSILILFEKGDQSKEKELTLFRLLEDLIAKAERIKKKMKQ
jgi:CheY-like chemotaxis protein/two-component sensor histidine kinase/HPt (histidine-containing phosphotransfer) domain-containing protein